MIYVPICSTCDSLLNVIKVPIAPELLLFEKSELDNDTSDKHSNISSSSKLHLKNKRFSNHNYILSKID